MVVGTGFSLSRLWKYWIGLPAVNPENLQIRKHIGLQKLGYFYEQVYIDDSAVLRESWKPG
jgi:hypothetical protein